MRAAEQVGERVIWVCGNRYGFLIVGFIAQTEGCNLDTFYPNYAGIVFLLL